MVIKPIPRKRRRNNDAWKTTIISFIAVSLFYFLPRMALTFLAVFVITLIGYLISGDFSGFLHTVGAEAIYTLLMWAIFCAFMAIRTIIAEKVTSKKKNYTAGNSKRVDKTDRNISRKRIAKQKTLAREAAKRKQQK